MAERRARQASGRGLGSLFRFSRRSGSPGLAAAPADRPGPAPLPAAAPPDVRASLPRQLGRRPCAARHRRHHGEDRQGEGAGPRRAAIRRCRREASGRRRGGAGGWGWGGGGARGAGPPSRRFLRGPRRGLPSLTAKMAAGGGAALPVGAVLGLPAPRPALPRVVAVRGAGTREGKRGWGWGKRGLPRVCARWREGVGGEAARASARGAGRGRGYAAAWCAPGRASTCERGEPRTHPPPATPGTPPGATPAPPRGRRAGGWGDRPPRRRDEAR